MRTHALLISTGSKAVVLNLYMHSYPLTFHQIFLYPLSEIK